MVGVAPLGVAIGAGSVWVSDAGGTVARLNPVTSRVQQIRVGGSPDAIAYADGAEWVANDLGGVFRVDPRTRLVRPIQVGNEPSGLTAARGQVLVTVLSSLGSHRGGSLTLAGPYTETSPQHYASDPAVAWDQPDWQMLAMTNDGLVGYRRVGGPVGDQLVPDLARDLPERCTLSRGIVTNNQAGTVTFHLTAPDPDFLDKLAIPFADAVPARTPDREWSTDRIPATGPYMTRSLQTQRAWVLVRNPRFRQWSAQAQPNGYPDRIVLRLGLTPGAAVDAVEHGRADVLFSSPPVSRVHELATRYANLLHTYPLASANALFLNARVRPFSNLAARRAVNYAIDRKKMIQLTGRAADRAANLPDPPADAHRLPALLPVHDQSRSQRRLAGAGPGARPATGPPVWDLERQGHSRDRPHAVSDAGAASRYIVFRSTTRVRWSCSPRVSAITSFTRSGGCSSTSCGSVDPLMGRYIAARSQVRIDA